MIPLNVKSAHYEIPTEESLIYVVRLSRVHVLERGNYGFTQSHHSLFEPETIPGDVRMCCGLRLVNVRPNLWSLRQWDEAVEWTQEHEAEMTILRKLGNAVPACLRCDVRFNQSEIAC